MNALRLEAVQGAGAPELCPAHGDAVGVQMQGAVYLHGLSARLVGKRFFQLVAEALSLQVGEQLGVTHDEQQDEEGEQAAAPERERAQGERGQAASAPALLHE